MAELPRPVTEYLYQAMGADRWPAYLEVTADGILQSFGGQADRYGLAGLSRGKPVQDQVVFLQGLLPTRGRRSCLPCVRVGSGAPADIHLFQDRDADWVLLLDASAFDARLRAVQQALYDRRLGRTPEEMSPSVFRALDMAVFERTSDGTLDPVSETPPWLTAPLPGSSLFLQNFVVDAEAVWQVDGESAPIRSGLWHEDGLMPGGDWWYATALKVHDRPLLIVTRSFAAAGSQQVLLQTGRERGLELSARTAELAAANGQLQAEHAELKVLEEQLRHAQKMEAVARLAGGIAHDFNNLLTVMIGCVELALAELEAAAPARVHIEEIGRAGQRAAALTRQLLAFSRKQILAPRPIDANDLVEQVGSLLRRVVGERVDLRIARAPSPALILADAGQLEQVLMNLAVNARDAMAIGGTLTISVSEDALSEEQATGFGVRPGRYVLVAVRDTGHGMDDQTRSRLFEPFFTTKPSGTGTGLGLATTYGIVRQSGGGISVQSAPGQGSCFTVCLPSLDPDHATAVAAVPTATPALPASHGSEVILLVEDDDAVRTLTAAMLKARGFGVIAAASGDEALRIAEATKAPIHLMLTDAVMPGISGRELGERMADLRPEMKVLLMSGYTDDAVLQLRIRSQDVAFLLKPFSSETLALRIRELLDAGPPPDAGRAARDAAS